MVWLCSAYVPAFHPQTVRKRHAMPECVPMVCDTLRSSAGLYGALLRSDPTERPEEPAIILCIHSRRHERSPQRPGMGCGGTLPALIRSPFLRAENVPCVVRSALLPSMCIYEHVFICCAFRQKYAFGVLTGFNPYYRLLIRVRARKERNKEK